MRSKKSFGGSNNNNFQHPGSFNALIRSQGICIQTWSASFKQLGF
jgi:hypothetical protein